MFQILHRKYDNLKNLLEFNLNNMEINLKQYSQNELINIFSIGAISNNILQIGFDEYKVLLFLLSTNFLFIFFYWTYRYIYIYQY